jgi:hypothetical protein
LDLAIQGSLVCLDRQEEVGSLLLELLKNAFWVCRASAWMSSPWIQGLPPITAGSWATWSRSAGADGGGVGAVAGVRP